MEPTDFQLFKGYIRYLVEEHISTVIFAAKEGDPLLTQWQLRDLWNKIQPWNKSKQDLWDCFEEFDEWKEDKVGSENEIFKEYIRWIAKNYLNDFFEMAREDDFRCEKDLWDCFECDPFEKFVEDYTSYLKEDHFGDCTGMATTCARCLAEYYFKE